MATKLIKDSTLSDIANAIRVKKEENSSYKPTEMANAILTIETPTEFGNEVFLARMISGNLNDNDVNTMLATAVGVEYQENIGGTICTPELTSIGQYCFYENTQITNIVIPQGYEVIQPYAFFRCSNLEYLTLNEGLNWIQGNAFSGCVKLKSVIFPSTFTRLYNYAFSGCSSLNNIILNEGLGDIGYAVFENTALTKVDLPNSLKTLDNGAFRGAPITGQFIFNQGIQQIGAQIFASSSKINSTLTSIKFKSKPVSISDTAFVYCDNLKNIYVPWASTDAINANAPWGAVGATIHYNYTS